MSIFEWVFQKKNWQHLVFFLGRALIFGLFCILISSCAFSSDFNSGSNFKNLSQAQKDQAAVLNTELGMHYFSIHENSLAQEKLEQALRLSPNLPEANDAMGYYLWKVGQVDQAKMYYQKAYQLAPHDPKVLNARGVYLCETGHPEEGLQSFLEAVKTPGFLAVGVTYQNAGDCAYQFGSKDLANQNLAIEYFEAALKEDPLLPLADLRLAELYKAQNNLPKAHYYLQRFNNIADPTPESSAIFN